MERVSGLTFSPEDHVYKFNGVNVPSVTQVIAAAGMTNWGGVNEDLLAHKRQLGTAVHHGACLIDDGTLDWATVHPETKPYLAAYFKFLEKYELKILASEQMLYSKAMRFAGTPDRILTLGTPGKVCVVDLKTSWELAASVGPQTAGYQLLWNQNNPKQKVKWRYALMLSPDESFDLILMDQQSDTAAFLAALQMYHWRYANQMIRKGE